MRKIHVAAGASVGVVALVASSLAASAAPVDDTDVSSTDQTAQTEGGEFVVAYEGDAAAATEAVAAAGGTVVDVNEAVGIALVEAPDGAFAAEVEATDAVTAVARNHSVGTVRPGRAAPLRRGAADDRRARRPPHGRHDGARTAGAPGGPSRSPTASGTWRRSNRRRRPTAGHRRRRQRRHHRHRHRRQSHPDLAANFDAERSRNFTIDIPAHRRAVRGRRPASTRSTPTTAATAPTSPASSPPTATGSAPSGVAPDATPGQPAGRPGRGYFFLYETLDALTAAGDLGLDVVNMSFYVDPWLYNCDSADDYISGGPVSDAELAEQALTRRRSPRRWSTPTTGASRWWRRRATSTPTCPRPQRSDAFSPDSHGRHRGHPRGAPTTASTCPARARTCSTCRRWDRRAPRPTTPTTGWARSTSPVRAVGCATWSAPPATSDARQPGAVVVPDRGRRSPRAWPTQPASRSTRTRSASCDAGAMLRLLHLPAGHVDGGAARGRGGGAGRPALRPGSPQAGYTLAPDRWRRSWRARRSDRGCPAGGTEVYTDEGRPRVLERGLPGHHRRQRLLRRRHRQRRQRRWARPADPTRISTLEDLGRAVRSTGRRRRRRAEVVDAGPQRRRGWTSRSAWSCDVDAEPGGQLDRRGRARSTTAARRSRRGTRRRRRASGRRGRARTAARTCRASCRTSTP